MLPLMLATNNDLNHINKESTLTIGEQEQNERVAMIAVSIIAGLILVPLGVLILTASLPPITSPLLGLAIGMIALGSLLVVIPTIIAICKKGVFSEIYAVEKAIEEMKKHRSQPRQTGNNQKL